MSSNETGCSLEHGFVPWKMFPQGTTIKKLDYKVQLFPFELLNVVHILLKIDVKISRSEAMKYLDENSTQAYYFVETEKAYEWRSKGKFSFDCIPIEKKAIAQTAKAEEKGKKQEKEKRLRKKKIYFNFI
jgi:hypothetical protein